MDYKKYKGGVDTMDKMLTDYSNKKRTVRWPLAFFFNMLNFGTISGLESLLGKKLVRFEGIPREKSKNWENADITVRMSA